MAAIGTERAQDLLDAATAAGITADDLAQAAGAVNGDPANLPYISGRAADAAQRHIDDVVAARAARAAAIREALRLARLGGHDPDTIAPKLDRMTATAIAKLVRDTAAYLRGRGVDTRPPAAPAPATDAQVNYIMDLLARRAASGEGGGFFHGPTDRAGVRRLTRADASAYIDSLKGTY
jgi:hypothetical protein